jgi:hypothetical protein
MGGRSFPPTEANGVPASQDKRGVSGVLVGSYKRGHALEGEPTAKTAATRSEEMGPWDAPGQAVRSKQQEAICGMTLDRLGARSTTGSGHDARGVETVSRLGRCRGRGRGLEASK